MIHFMLYSWVVLFVSGSFAVCLLAAVCVISALLRRMRFAKEPRSGNWIITLRPINSEESSTSFRPYNQLEDCLIGGHIYHIGDSIPGYSPCEKCVCVAAKTIHCEITKCHRVKSTCKLIQDPEKCCPEYICDLSDQQNAKLVSSAIPNVSAKENEKPELQSWRTSQPQYESTASNSSNIANTTPSGLTTVVQGIDQTSANDESYSNYSTRIPRYANDMTTGILHDLVTEPPTIEEKDDYFDIIPNKNNEGPTAVQNSTLDEYNINPIITFEFDISNPVDNPELPKKSFTTLNTVKDHSPVEVSEPIPSDQFKALEDSTGNISLEPNFLQETITNDAGATTNKVSKPNTEKRTDDPSELGMNDKAIYALKYIFTVKIPERYHTVQENFEMVQRSHSNSNVKTVNEEKNIMSKDGGIGNKHETDMVTKSHPMGLKVTEDLNRGDTWDELDLFGEQNSLWKKSKNEIINENALHRFTHPLRVHEEVQRVKSQNKANFLPLMDDTDDLLSKYNEISYQNFNDTINDQQNLFGSNKFSILEIDLSFEPQVTGNSVKKIAESESKKNANEYLGTNLFIPTPTGFIVNDMYTKESKTPLMDNTKNSVSQNQEEFENDLGVKVTKDQTIRTSNKEFTSKLRIKNAQIDSPRKDTNDIFIATPTGYKTNKIYKKQTPVANDSSFKNKNSDVVFPPTGINHGSNNFEMKSANSIKGSKVETQNGKQMSQKDDLLIPASTGYKVSGMYSEKILSDHKSSSRPGRVIEEDSFTERTDPTTEEELDAMVPIIMLDENEIVSNFDDGVPITMADEEEISNYPNLKNVNLGLLHLKTLTCVDKKTADGNKLQQCSIFGKITKMTGAPPDLADLPLFKMVSPTSGKNKDNAEKKAETQSGKNGFESGTKLDEIVSQSETHSDQEVNVDSKGFSKMVTESIKNFERKLLKREVKSSTERIIPFAREINSSVEGITPSDEKNNASNVDIILNTKNESHSVNKTNSSYQGDVSITYNEQEPLGKNETQNSNSKSGETPPTSRKEFENVNKDNRQPQKVIKSNPSSPKENTVPNAESKISQDKITRRVYDPLMPYPEAYPDEYQTIQNGPAIIITRTTYTRIPDVTYTTVTTATLPTYKQIEKAEDGFAQTLFDARADSGRSTITETKPVPKEDTNTNYTTKVDNQHVQENIKNESVGGTSYPTLLRVNDTVVSTSSLATNSEERVKTSKSGKLVTQKSKQSTPHLDDRDMKIVRNFVYNNLPPI